MSSQSRTPPGPERVFETLFAHQRTAALKAAIDLDIFTAIGEGVDTVAALANRCKATARGVRILCDYLAILGFLTKQDQRYALTEESAKYLDRRSPACIASIADFMTLPEKLDAFKDLAAVIRAGRPALSQGKGSISPENPIWVSFARSMGAMQVPAARELARIVNAGAAGKWKVLDIAAGHGVYGIELAKQNPNAEVFAQDWAAVLDVAEENARAAGVARRFHRLPGSAFEVEFGSGYDIVLITGFLHHFGPAEIEGLLRKVRSALAPGGVVVTVDFVPNEDRLSPPRAAAFSMEMLGTTVSGDAYTFSEYERMFRNAGFSSNELRPAMASGHSLILSKV
jgi:2-polyprenyl-3-methyl-5-hydroxy-6-metoxy-1,4-benzoquinol methylase